MVLIKKVDVENYLASRKRKGFRPYRPPSQPDATGVSGKPFAGADSSAPKAVANALNQPSSSVVEAPQNKPRTDSDQVAILTKSKGARV